MANVRLQLDENQVVREKNGNEVYKARDPDLYSSKTNSPTAYYPGTSGIQAILKKGEKVTKQKRPLHYESKDVSNVTWKEPLADTKFLPTGRMKVPVVPKVYSAAQSSSRENTRTKSKNSSIHSNGKRVHVTEKKQGSIRVTERSEKNGKSYKRNNRRKNNNKPITNVNSGDNSSSDYGTGVNKTGKRNDDAAANKIESQCSEEIVSGRGMSVISLKSQKESVLPTDASTTSRKSFFKHIFKCKNEPSCSKVAEKAVAKEFVIQQNPVTLSNNNKKVVHIQSTNTTISSKSTGINSQADATPESEFNVEAKWKWANEAKLRVVDDAFIYSIHKEDLNENAIVNSATQKHAKLCSNNDIKEKGVIKDDDVSSSFSSCLSKLDGTSNPTEENLVGSLEKDGTKKQLMSEAGQKTIANSEKNSLRNCTAADVNNNNENNLGLRFYFGKNSKIRRVDTVESILQRLKPPTLPEFGVCTVLPGTQEWETYWDNFNKKICGYYSSVEAYSKQMDDLLVDDDGYEYKRELKRRYQEEVAVKLSMGMTLSKPPLFRHPLKDTVEIGGYVIRPLGGVVASAHISTFDHVTFRLEISFGKIDSSLDGIVIDKKFNMMTITIPQGENSNHCVKLVQISVPPSKNVQNLEIGNPLYNGGNLVIVGK